jgi:hypothetical protein
MNYELEVKADRIVTFKMPHDIPLGRHQFTLVIDDNPIPNDKEGFKKLLAQTQGIWKQGDGLAYQTQLREEWDDR